MFIYDTSRLLQSVAALVFENRLNCDRVAYNITSASIVQ